MLHSFLPKYTSSWQPLLYLFLIFGNPKMPFLGIPLALVAFIFDWKNVLGLYKTKIGIIQITVVIAFTAFFFIRVFLGSGEFLVKNLIFCFTLSYKALLGLYLSYLIIYLIQVRNNLIAIFLLIQTALIVLSAFNRSLYDFLLFFQTSEATVVFGEIFGIRSLGFGVIHNEGIVALTLLYVLYAEFSSASRFLINTLGILTCLSALSSRLVIVLLPIWMILKNKKLFIIIVLLCVLIVSYLDVMEGPLSQVFELYTYYKETGSIGSQSTNALMGMKNIPDSFGTWIIGDGQFFSDYGFYQDTDIGFSRILFFGGLTGLLFYVVICCWPLYFILKISSLSLLLFFLYVCLASNIKGINIQTWSFIVCFYFFHRLHTVGQLGYTARINKNNNSR